jgi:hypothetical protein
MKPFAPDPDPFYIGWQEALPAPYRPALRRALLSLLLLMPSIAALLVLSQRGFEDSVFEFGQISTQEGFLVLQPVPMLKVPESQASGGRPRYRSLLLVGLGKRGAMPSLQALAQAQGLPLDSLAGCRLRLRGSRIYYQQKEALELTEGAGAFAGQLPGGESYLPSHEALGEASLRGEILDPKCALGVMKPGQGKPHRSCAIRCISGGIPPVLRVPQPDGSQRHCLLVNEDGSPAGPRLLPYVADPVRLCGRLARQDDWLLLYLPEQLDIERLPGGGICGGT